MCKVCLFSQTFDLKLKIRLERNLHSVFFLVVTLGVFTLLLDGPHLHKAAAPPHGAQSSLCTQVQLVLLPPSELCLHLCLHCPVQCYSKSHSEQGAITSR